MCCLHNALKAVGSVYLDSSVYAWKKKNDHTDIKKPGTDWKAITTNHRLASSMYNKNLLKGPTNEMRIHNNYCKHFTYFGAKFAKQMRSYSNVSLYYEFDSWSYVQYHS